MIQRKLVVGEAGGAFEREADTVAERVVRTGPPVVQRKAECTCGGGPSCKCDEAAEITPAPGLMVARAEIDPSIPFIPDSAYDPSAPEEEAGLRRKAAGPSAPVSGAVEQAIGAARGAGEALPPAARADMERGFGHDFRDVRVHTGPSDGALAESLNARAFTVGSDVFFAPGQFRPYSVGGRRLLAHELTHVVQQRTREMRIQRSEADTLAQCPLYWRYETPRLQETYNCAGLAWRTYDFRGNLTAERSAVTAGRAVGCSGRCNPGEVKHWWWDYDIHLETPDGRRTTANRDFHTVAGVTDRAGSDPNDVFSKNGKRPVYGPGTGPGFRPPARDRATSNDAAETPATAPDGAPLFKVRTSFNEQCACHPCPPARP